MFTRSGQRRALSDVKEKEDVVRTMGSYLETRDRSRLRGVVY